MAIRYHGKHGAAYLGATASPASASRVNGLTTWSIALTQDVAEVTALGDDYKSFVVGVKGGTMAFKGFHMSDEDVPFDAYDIGGKVTCYLYPSADNTARYWWGNVWPTSVSVEDPVSGPVTLDFAGTFDSTFTRVG